MSALFGPSQILSKHTLQPLDGIEQLYMAVPHEEGKLGACVGLCDTLKTKHVVIYCDTRREVRLCVSCHVTHREFTR